MSRKLDQATLDEIKRKAYANESLTDPTAEKQFYYDSYKNQMNSQANKPQDYESAFGGQMNDLMNQIMNKPKFEYDMENDKMYQSYKEQYNREGDRAMKNSMAEAANLTGGRTNSWAVSAGQQAQDYYNQKLNDKVPELQMAAYQMYNNDLQQKQQQLAMMQQQDQMAYQKWQDQYSRWNDEQNRNYQMMMDKYNIGSQSERWGIEDNRYNDELKYNRDWQNKEWDYNTSWKDKEWDNMINQQNQAQSNWNAEFGFKKQQAAADNAYRNAGLASRKSGGGRSSSSKKSATKNPYTNQQLITQAKSMMSMEDDEYNAMYGNNDIIDWVLANAGSEEQAMQVLNFMDLEEEKKKPVSQPSNPMRSPQFIDPKITGSFFRK